MTLGVATRYTRDVEDTNIVYFYVFLYTHAERYIEEYTTCLYVVHTHFTIQLHKSARRSTSMIPQ